MVLRKLEGETEASRRYQLSFVSFDAKKLPFSLFPGHPGGRAYLHLSKADLFAMRQ
jgi:hypothetical protein